MSMTIEEAIKRIRSHMRNHHIGEYPHIHIKEAMDMAIAALQEKAERENPKPLTIEELKQMGGCPVYVIPLQPFQQQWEGWHLMYDDCSGAAVPGIEYWNWSLEDYGETWIAYRHKPKEVQK